MKGSVIKRVGWWKDELSLICLDEHKTLEGGGVHFREQHRKVGSGNSLLQVRNFT